jgi:hypothetical protein
VSHDVAAIPGTVITYYAGPGDQPHTRRRVQILDTRTGQMMSWNAHQFSQLIQALELQGPICRCGQLHDGALVDDDE